MCLSRVKQKFDPPLKKEVMAWKFIHLEKGVPFSPIYRCELTFNDWTTCRSRLVMFYDENGSDDYYFLGFHVFVNKASAETALEVCKINYKDLNLHLIRVIVRNITSRGVQYFTMHNKRREATILVAKQIFCFVHLHEPEAKTSNQTELALK